MRRHLSRVRVLKKIAWAKSSMFLAIATLLLCLPAVSTGNGEAAFFLSPGEIATSPDGLYLYVVCEESNELRVVDTRSFKVVRVLHVGLRPKGIAVARDGSVFVTSAWDDKLYAFDPTLALRSVFETGFEPSGAAVDSSGSVAYVSNRLSNDISLIDVASGKEIKRLLGGRGVSQLVLSDDGKIYATHVYPNPGVLRGPPTSELTVIDPKKRSVVKREVLTNSAGVFGIAASKDGELVIAAELRPKNLIPLAHVERGWVFGNSVLVYEPKIGALAHVPIDEMDRYFSMPYGVQILPDKTKIYITCAGSDVVTVIDTARMLKTIRAQPISLQNDLSAAPKYVIARIKTGKNPRGGSLSPDGTRLYVSNRMDDTVSVIATQNDRVIRTIDLGGSKTLTPRRRGEVLFNSSKYSFQEQFGCANCHIDSSFDALTWDLEPDGFGVDIVDNRTIENINGTEPFKWNAGNPDLATECGPRTEKYFYRSQSYNEDELRDLVAYLQAIRARPNRFLALSGDLSSTQERGRVIFHRTIAKNGKQILSCAACHTAPKYTNLQTADVGTRKLNERSSMVDVPQLNNVWMTAPYLHDGSAKSLEEIWTVFNPQDTHGVTNDLTKEELNDLIEYLKTL